MSAPTPAADRIPFPQKLAYGAGAFVNNLLAAAIGGMSIVLNLGLGMDPAVVGYLGALPRLFDALTDPIAGYLSDHTRSRWGRRRPWILVGAISVGLVFALLWQFPTHWTEAAAFWYFLLGSLIFYTCYTIFATPWVALGYELTPDYHERTRLMGVQNFLGQFAYLVSPWFLWFMTQPAWFGDLMEGARVLAVLVGVVAVGLGLLPAIFLRERFIPPPVAAPASSLKESAVDFLQGLRITLRTTPFLLLASATFLVFNGFILVSSFQSYVIIYYVFGGDQAAGATYAGYSGSLGAASTFVVIAVVTALSTRIGKRGAFFVAIGLSMVGYLAKWFCYDPDAPWKLLLPAPLLAFGLGGLFTLMGSMVADVVDLDELETHHRREGMFGSIFWWVVKLGMAAALAGGGWMLRATGFDVALGGNQSPDTLFWMRVADVAVPVLTSGLAILAVFLYPLDEATARSVRERLEARRGAG